MASQPFLGHCFIIIIISSSSSSSNSSSSSSSSSSSISTLSIFLLWFQACLWTRHADVDSIQHFQDSLSCHFLVLFCFALLNYCQKWMSPSESRLQGLGGEKIRVFVLFCFVLFCFSAHDHMLLAIGYH
jgi:cytosine/uracil/thiamine/allantoin permease